MIVRSLHLVNFGGAAEWRLAAAPERGVVRGAVGVAAGDALRFVFLGAAAPDASGARGPAVVETGVLLDDGREASVFRGEDRRGGSQASLRERTGPRLAGGDVAVRARLAELVGAPLEVWERATWIGVAAEPADPFGGAAPAAAAGPGVRTARDACDRATDMLRRALRTSALRDRVGAEHAALCALGGRLRNARTAASVETGELTAERERLRVRLRRLAEYRERAAKEQGAATDAETPAAARAGGWAERGALVAGALLVFAIVESRAVPGASRDPLLSILLGLALLACFASYVASSARRDAAARPAAAPRDGKCGEWRDALRHLYTDLGDPDDPALPAGLRKRLAAVERRLAPLTKRLQELDEAVSAFDVEAGRASKTTHGAVVPHADGDAALGPDESPAAAEAEVARIGETLCRAAVEMQTLVEGGTSEVTPAVTALRVALHDLGAACGDAAAAETALLHAHVEGDAPPDAATLCADEDLCVRLADDVAAIGRAPMAVTGDVDGVAALTARAAGAEFTVAAAASGLAVRRRGAAVAWLDLPEAVRERIAFALALRRAEESLGPRAGTARFVVIDRRPAGLDDDEALAELVRAAAPTAVQVVVGSVAPSQDAASAPATARGVTPR